MKKKNAPKLDAKLFVPTIEDEKRVAGILSELFSSKVGIGLSDGSVVPGTRDKMKVVAKGKK